MGRPHLGHSPVPEVLVSTSFRVMAWHLSTHVPCGNPHELFTWNKDQSPNLWQLYSQGMSEGGRKRALIMIKAQKAATEGAHVAVPEGLVPAKKMTMVIADTHSPPRPPHRYESFLLFSASRELALPRPRLLIVFETVSHCSPG